MRLTVVVFATAAVLFLGVGLLPLAVAPLHGTHPSEALKPSEFLARDSSARRDLLVGAFHLMNTAPPLVSPAVASVVYCLEPVFRQRHGRSFSEQILALAHSGGVGLVAAGMIGVRVRRRSKSFVPARWPADDQGLAPSACCSKP